MTATAKILKTATETPKELIKLIKIIKTQVLPAKCLSGSWVDAPGGERGRSRGCMWSQRFLLSSWKHRAGARRRARATPLLPACLSSQCTAVTGLAWYSPKTTMTSSLTIFNTPCENPLACCPPREATHQHYKGTWGCRHLPSPASATPAAGFTIPIGAPMLIRDQNSIT